MTGRRSILTVGPRKLPSCGWAMVWIDTGSGPGFTRLVRTERLSLASIDDGQNDHAIYNLDLGEERDRGV